MHLHFAGDFSHKHCVINKYDYESYSALYWWCGLLNTYVIA